jgi:hypothetical protein
MKRILLGLLVVAVLLFAVFVVVRLSVSSGDVPQELGALELDRAVVGNDARAIVDRMHGRTVTPSRSAVGYYSGPGGKAALYVSRYAHSDSATAVLARMAKRIDRPGGPFDQLRLLPADRNRTYMCLGLGQAHFFFACREYLVWLSVDIPLAQTTLDAVEGTFCGEVGKVGAF